LFVSSFCCPACFATSRKKQQKRKGWSVTFENVEKTSLLRSCNLCDGYIFASIQFNFNVGCTQQNSNGKKLIARATKPLNKKRVLKPSGRKRISYSRFSDLHKNAKTVLSLEAYELKVS